MMLGGDDRYRSTTALSRISGQCGCKSVNIDYGNQQTLYETEAALIRLAQHPFSVSNGAAIKPILTPAMKALSSSLATMAAALIN